MDTHQQHRDQVQLTLTVRTSPPHTISISNPNPAKPLQLICTITQTASPFLDRAVTILIKYSCLDTSSVEDAFFLRAMSSPKLVSEPGSEQSAQNAAPELPMRPVGKHTTTTRISGNPDLARRGAQDGFTFLTIPPIGQGQEEVRFDIPPSKMLKRLGDKSNSLEEKIARFPQPGTSYKVSPSDLSIRWWNFESLQGENGLMKKHISRWTLPNDLPLVRESGVDERDEVADMLIDLVDLHDVNHLSSRSAVEDEEKPVIRDMRSDGWVFGEPSNAL